MRDDGYPIPEEAKITESSSKETFPLPAEYLAKLEALGLQDQKHAYEKVLELGAAIKAAGGRALLVGGSVRDGFFGKIPKDFDIEVYGLSAKKVEEIVRLKGKVNEVGAAFGILKLSFGKGIEVDISLPRTDSKVSEGHKGFEVKTDPQMSIIEAARRRDFTMNTVSANPLTGEIHDPFGGVKDIKERCLRITDKERFADDPLRVLRGAQFVGRFGLEVEPESMQILQEMSPRLKEISKERVLEEWKKLLLKSEKPSLGLALCMAVGAIRVLHPELLKIREQAQVSEIGEGVDPWMCVLKTVDEAAKIARRESLSQEEAFILLLACVAGNFVKGDVAGGRESVPAQKIDTKLAESFLNSMKADNETKKLIFPLIASRYVPLSFYVDQTHRNKTVSDGQIRRLAKQIHPVNIRTLVLFAEADYFGRREEFSSHDELLLPADQFPVRDWLLERARSLGVDQTKPGHTIQGQEWLAFGFKPGPDLGRLIALSNDLRDEKEMTPEAIFQFVDGCTSAASAAQKLTELLHS